MPPFQPGMHQRGEPSPPARPRLRAGLSLAAISTPKPALDPASFPPAIRSSDDLAVLLSDESDRRPAVALVFGARPSARLLI
jgi:hypothetical protein